MELAYHNGLGCSVYSVATRSICYLLGRIKQGGVISLDPRLAQY